VAVVLKDCLAGVVFVDAPVIPYASPHPRKPFRWRLFIFPFASLAVTVVFYTAARFPEYHYLGSPRWLLSFGGVSFAFVIFGILSAIICLCLIALRYRSLPELLAGICLTVTFLFATPFVQMSAQRELFVCCKDPPFIRLMANARNLGQSAFVFASEHDDHYPPHPAVLLLGGKLSPKQLSDYDLSPYVLPSPLPPESAWSTIAADVDAHSTFIYTAADLQNPPGAAFLDPAIIIAYTKPNRVTPGHRIVLFADFSARLVPNADLAKTFAASNTARAKLHLPPFILDGPPPPPPVSPTSTSTPGE
jgi:hypothetical protein